MDDSGNVYIAGEASLGGAGGSEMLLAKFAADSRECLWTRLLGYDGGERAQALALDGAGSLYVAGRISSLDSLAAGDMAVLRYDLDGNLLNAWSWGGAGVEDTALALAAYSENGGGCLVAGATSHGSSADAVVVDFTPNGTQRWAARYGGTGVDTALAVSRDADGSVVVAGQLNSGGVNPRALLLRYDQTGNLLTDYTWSAGPSAFYAASLVSANFTICGSALTSSGSWQPGAGVSETIPDQTSLLTGYLITTPSSSLLFPMGSDSTPLGFIEDDGGGGEDALMIWYTPGS